MGAYLRSFLILIYFNHVAKVVQKSFLASLYPSTSKGNCLQGSLGWKLLVTYMAGSTVSGRTGGH